MQNYYDPKELGVNNYWWDESEYFWMEITDRDQSDQISQMRGAIGDNIWAPTHDTNGVKRKWSYSLVALVKPGDIVFHYSKTKNAIVGYSKVKTYAYEDTGVWGAQGSYASSSKPFMRNLFKADLIEFIEYDNPMTIEEIREKQEQLFSLINRLKDEKGTLYQPFVIKNNQVEPPQAYFVKMPRKVLGLLNLIDESKIKQPNSTFVKKTTKSSRTGKTRKVNTKRNKVVELYAMKIATNYFEQLGYEVEDTSQGTFDLTCYKDEEIIYVEVKGTQMDFNKVTLTKNEVRGHRINNKNNALVVVAEISLDKDEIASGGVRFVQHNWYPEDKDLEATMYNYKLNDDKFQIEKI